MKGKRNNIMEKMTKREMYTAMINFAETGKFTYTRGEAEVTVDAETVAAFATHEIELLDKRAAKDKETRAAKAAEPDALEAAILEVIPDEFTTLADIAALVEGEDVTVGKVTYRLNALAKAGKVEKGEIKFPGGEGKRARTVKAFKRV